MHLDLALSSGFNGPRYLFVPRVLAALLLSGVGMVLLVENRRGIPLARFAFGAGVVGQLALLIQRYRFYLAGQDELSGTWPFLIVAACALLGGLLVVWSFRLGLSTIFALIGILVAKLITMVPFLNSDILYLILATCLLFPFAYIGYRISPLFDIVFSAVLGGILFMTGVDLFLRTEFSSYVFFDLRVVYTPAPPSVAFMTVLAFLLAFTSLIVNYNPRPRNDYLALNRSIPLSVVLNDCYSLTQIKIHPTGLL